MSRKSEDAAFFEAHKDDQDLWEEVAAPADVPRRTGLTATITVRFSAEEAEAIRQVAREAHLTYSQVVRKAVEAYTRPRFAVTGGGNHQWFSQDHTTHSGGSSARFEPEHPDPRGTRTRLLLGETGDSY